MFGWWPRLPVNFVFPTIGSNEAPMREASARNVDMYVATVRDQLRSALWEAQAQLTTEACQQKQYYDRKIGTVNLKPGDLVLVKANAWKGKRKIKDRWDEETWDVSQQIAADVPSYKVTNQYGWSWVPHWKPASSHCVRGWHSLVYGQLSYTGQVYQSHPTQDYLLRRWWREDATREQWQGSHLMTYQ